MKTLLRYCLFFSYRRLANLVVSKYTLVRFAATALADVTSFAQFTLLEQGAKAVVQLGVLKSV